MILVSQECRLIPLTPFFSGIKNGVWVWDGFIIMPQQSPTEFASVSNVHKIQTVEEDGQIYI